MYLIDIVNYRIPHKQLIPQYDTVHMTHLCLYDTVYMYMIIYDTVYMRFYNHTYM